MRRVWVLAAVVAASCTARREYRRPDVHSPEEFRGTRRAEAGSIGDKDWAEVFSDPTLQELIRSALRRNHDVAIAAVRSEEARAQLGIARADQLPW